MASKKPSAGDVQVVLPKLHPGQLRVRALLARFVVVMCGRRWGKTIYGLRVAADDAIAGKNVGWFVPGYKYATEVWRELIRRLGPIIATKNEQERRIELVTGGVIEIWTLDTDDPARGRDYDTVIIDEAGLVSNILTVWQEAIRATLVDRRGRALFLGTPKGRRHGFVVLFARGERGDDPDWASVRASTLENPHIPADEVESARRELPPEAFRQEFEGIPTDDGANPFGLDAIRTAVGAASSQPVVCYGLDLARSTDWTVLYGIDAWRRWVVVDRWQAPWAVTKEKVRALVGQVPVVADATGVGDAIVADLQGSGLDVTAFVFTQSSKLRLMQRLIAAFQGKELQVPDGWLKTELESFEFTYTNTGVRYEAPPGLHDDGVMALALALHGWDRVQGVTPDPAFAPAARGDDPAAWGDVTLPLTNVGVSGDFAQQLPSDGF